MFFHGLWPFENMVIDHSTQLGADMHAWKPQFISSTRSLVCL